MSLFEVHIGNSVTFKRPASLSVWVGIKLARPEELRGILKNPRSYWADQKTPCGENNMPLRQTMRKFIILNKTIFTIKLQFTKGSLKKCSLTLLQLMMS